MRSAKLTRRVRRDDCNLPEPYSVHSFAQTVTEAAWYVAGCCFTNDNKT